ncbi:uncharacterized protein MONBRDRAFT_16657, partial [Monosiga brevicollis MX1]
VFGEKQHHELCPGGAKRSLSQANKHEFVRLYTDWVLNVSVEHQFAAFKYGFMTVMAQSATLRMIDVSEMRALICGLEDLDLNQLREVARYEGGYNANSPVIKWFWEVALNFSDNEKRAFLQFTTGTRRAPVGGLRTMKFIIAKQGADSERLPTSHTCFNALMIPEYSSKEKLEQLLKKAIQYSEGFGML